jgi:AmmeMemoRadiSam system protein A
MDQKTFGKSGCIVKQLVFLSGIFVFVFLSSASSAGEAGQNKSDTGIATQIKNAKEKKMADSEKLNNQEGRYLLEVARRTIQKELFKDQAAVQEDEVSSSSFAERRGTFVTLTINDNLRGCIGHIIPQETLLEGIKENAINAAFKDPRFNPLSKKEWDKVRIEISILTDPKPLEYSNADDLLKKIRTDTDGVIIKKGYYQATFLPQVWEQLPDKKEFFTHLCLKAGMDGDEWKKGKLEVYTYQVQAFEEE